MLLPPHPNVIKTIRIFRKGIWHLLDIFLQIGRKILNFREIVIQECAEL